MHRTISPLSLWNLLLFSLSSLVSFSPKLPKPAAAHVYRRIPATRNVALLDGSVLNNPAVTQALAAMMVKPIDAPSSKHHSTNQLHWKRIYMFQMSNKLDCVLYLWELLDGKKGRELDVLIFDWLWHTASSIRLKNGSHVMRWASRICRKPCYIIEYLDKGMVVLFKWYFGHFFSFLRHSFSGR